MDFEFGLSDDAFDFSDDPFDLSTADNPLSVEKITGEFILYVKARPRVEQIKQQIEKELTIPATIQRIKLGDGVLADDGVLYASRFTLEVIDDRWKASSPGKDHFTVYDVASEFAITVNSWSTVVEIKQKIEEARKIPASQQKITFIGNGSSPIDTFPVSASVFGSRILLNRIIGEASTSAAPQAVFPCAFTVHYTNVNFALVVNSLLMVREIKNLIEEQLHISAAKQNLMLLDNHILRDDEFVSPYTVGSDLKLELITDPVSDLLKESRSPLNLRVTLMKISDLLVEIAGEFSVRELKKMLRERKDMAGVGSIRVYAGEVELKDGTSLNDYRDSELKVHLINAPPQTLSIYLVHRSGPSTSVHAVQVDTNHTLWDVRRKLANDIVFPMDHFFILEDDRVMRDGVTFGDFGVKSGCHLFLIKDKYEPF